MADYTIQFKVSITPDVDPNKLQLTLNSYSNVRQRLSSCIRNGLMAVPVPEPLRRKYQEPDVSISDVTVTLR